MADITRKDTLEEALPGVPLGEATAPERRWLEDRLALLRAGNNTSRGSFAEVLVAEALPGSSLTGPWSVHDVLWDSYTIQVKTSAGYQYWHAPTDKPSVAKWECPPTLREVHDPDNGQWAGPAPRRWSDVWVFARHEGKDITAGWRFHAVPRWWLDERSKNSIREAELSKAWPSCSSDDLGAIIVALPLHGTDSSAPAEHPESRRPEDALPFITE